MQFLYQYINFTLLNKTQLNRFTMYNLQQNIKKTTKSKNRPIFQCKIAKNDLFSSVSIMQFNWLLDRNVRVIFIQTACSTIVQAASVLRPFHDSFSKSKIDRKNPVYQTCQVRCRKAGTVMRLVSITPTPTPPVHPNKIITFVKKHSRHNIPHKTSNNTINVHVLMYYVHVHSELIWKT